MGTLEYVYAHVNVRVTQRAHQKSPTEAYDPSGVPEGAGLAFQARTTARHYRHPGIALVRDWWHRIATRV